MRSSFRVYGLQRYGLCALLLLALSGCSITHAYRVADGQRIDVTRMVEELGDVPLVLVGEEHDDMAHHELQLDVITRLHQQGRPLAIGLEMFETPHQGALDAWVAGRLPERAFIPVYQVNWRNLSWAYYRDLFVYARDQRIPLVALNAPRDLVQKVARLGFAALSDADLKTLPADVNVALTVNPMGTNAGFMPGHNPQATRYMAQAQALRNRVMAHSARRYLQEHPQTRLVVLTGGLHAWREGGIPAELGDLPHAVILPPMSGLNLMERNRRSADYVLD